GRVAVEEGAPPCLASRLEAASGAAKLDDGCLGVLAGDVREIEYGECCRRVAPVVLSRHREVELHRLPLLGAYDVGHVAQPLGEERLELGPGDERGVVVEIDV